MFKDDRKDESDMENLEVVCLGQSVMIGSS